MKCVHDRERETCPDCGASAGMQALASSQRYYQSALRPFPTGHQKFLGLYLIKGEPTHIIIQRASKPEGDLQFVQADHHGDFAYYVNNPMAWAPLPIIPGNF